MKRLYSPRSRISAEPTANDKYSTKAKRARAIANATTLYNVLRSILADGGVLSLETELSSDRESVTVEHPKQAAALGLMTTALSRAMGSEAWQHVDEYHAFDLVVSARVHSGTRKWSVFVKLHG